MREVTNARQNRGRSLPALVQFFQTPRANARLKSSSNRRNAFRENTNSRRDARKLSHHHLSLMLFERRASRRDTKKQRERIFKNVPGRTPRRCTIDRRNNPSRSRPRRIKRWFRWNLSPRLRLSRLGTRPSERRFELGRGNPFVRYYYVCACVLRVEILKETPFRNRVSRVMRCSRVFGRRKAKRVRTGNCREEGIR